MARFSIGFALGSVASIIGAVVQWKVYQTSPCGWHATDCDLGVSRVSLAWQIPMVVLPAIGEVFVSVTSCESGRAARLEANGQTSSRTLAHLRE
jgi:POT family proton-dependent oligopeptide transporter